MEIIKAIVLGFIQGLTEFLPVSSSGHLVLGAQILQFQEQGVAFDIFVHFGTLISVCIAFRKEIMAMMVAPFAILAKRENSETRMYFLWDMYVIVATIPAVFAGLMLKDSIESIFSNILLVFSMLFVTGLLMVFSHYVKDRGKELSSSRAFLIGCAQACAIFPGLSRSGSTIFVGILLGIDRQTVARFSFIMSIPAILGAVVLQAGELLQDPPPTDSIIAIAAGTVMSAVSGYFAIVLLLDIVRKNRLQWFGYYCLLLSGAGFGWYFFVG